jgi:hypothetical protein
MVEIGVLLMNLSNGVPKFALVGPSMIGITPLKHKDNTLGI